ncbi:hypothetical protein BIW11_06796 [Tropilaelaps mercedesae]|uniref:Uncharacterized protein n=1 Tax=Tropilaelaps mercedesae TaxID=418985 RepID=A0A1V9XWH4_9ACAR|nr:hypothetical protein BIW11_06796 [Tropilaelaps mercedesae]
MPGVHRQRVWPKPTPFRSLSGSGKDVDTRTTSLTQQMLPLKPSASTSREGNSNVWKEVFEDPAMFARVEGVDWEQLEQLFAQTPTQSNKKNLISRLSSTSKVELHCCSSLALK